MKNIRKTPLSFEKKQEIAGYIFILPIILGAAILFIPNIIRTVVFSLNEINLTGNGYSLSFGGLKNYYEALFVNADFIQYVLKSFGEMAVYVPTIIVFSLFMASVLNQRFHGRVAARAIFFLPVVLATGIVTKTDMAYDLVAILTNRDLMDESSTQLFATAQLLYSLNFSEALTKIVVNAANGIENIVNSSGMQIFILLAAFQEIPVSSYEAAAVEGCSKWETFWKITIPSVKSQIIVTVVYTVIDIFTKTDNSLFNFIHSTAFEGNRYSFAMAMYIIYLLSLGVMLAIIMLVIRRASRKNGEEGY